MESINLESVKERMEKHESQIKVIEEALQKNNDILKQTQGAITHLTRTKIAHVAALETCRSLMDENLEGGKIVAPDPVPSTDEPVVPIAEGVTEANDGTETENTDQKE